MISIIISSANAAQLHQVKQNIAQTIGVPYEVIGIDNSTGSKGICQIYNEGTRQAAYDLICYMHEDIELLTPDWGVYVTETFKQHSRLGALGVAGCSYKTVAPSGWVAYGNLKILHYNLMQSYKHTAKATEHLHHNSTQTQLAKVVTLDGVWICARKSAALAYPFDEQLLTGFHGYDIDFTLALSRHYDIAVTYEVLLRHFSEGRFEAEWLAATLQVADKYRKHLPLSTISLSKKEQADIEVKTAKHIILKMLEAGYSAANIRAEVWKLKGTLNLFKRLKLWNYTRKKA
ncbi:hypothetical protein GCM10027037_21730 [Mucilaginibacter koreensis]